MKRSSFLPIIGVIILLIIISYFAASIIFKLPDKKAMAPVIQPINQNFPDVTSDPAYTSIFNSNALDPTQPVQIGGSNNNQPFVGH